MDDRTLISRVRGFADRLCREVNIHGFLLSAGGNVIAGGTRDPFRIDRPHRLYSVSKTFTGIAVGMLADDGNLSLDDPVVKYFPDWLPEQPSGYLLRLKIRDMLRMATCYRRTAYREYEDFNWALSFFAGTPDHEPGTVFSYDTGNTQVLAALVRRVSGLEVIDFLEERLFRPLGCRDPRYWLRDPSGCCTGGTGLCMSLGDLHRTAQCLLDGGKGLVPAWYVREMSKKHIDTVLQDKDEERWGYGWLCWRTRSGWAMYGMGGQLSVLCPEKRLILSTVGDTRLDPCGVQKIYDAFFEEIEPFVEPGGCFAGEIPGSPLLLRLPPMLVPDDGQIAPSGFGEYFFPEGNALGIESLRFRDCGLELCRAGKTARLSFRRGEAVLTEYPGHPEEPALVAAGWLGEGLLRIRCDAIGDAPCGFDMLLSLLDGRITVQSRCSSDPLTAGYDGIASGFLKNGGSV